jgi:hypothetical protein
VYSLCAVFYSSVIYLLINKICCGAFASQSWFKKESSHKYIPKVYLSPKLHRSQERPSKRKVQTRRSQNCLEAAVFHSWYTTLPIVLVAAEAVIGGPGAALVHHLPQRRRPRPRTVNVTIITSTTIAMTPR